MAYQLKKQYDLIVLKADLMPAMRSESNVRFTLQCKIKGELTDVRHWNANTRDMGFSQKFDNIQLPADLIADLNEWMHQKTAADRPLWVHLVKPYGELRFVPWERLLGRALGVPILMLPDFIFPRPRESTSAFEVALCASAPLGREDHWIREAIRVSAQSIVNATNRALRLHVFTDSELADTARKQLAPMNRPGAEIIVHTNGNADKYCAEDISSRLVDRLGVVRSPWLLWMREQLRNRSIDVMHFACHGYLSRDRGAMLFAQSPLIRTGSYLAGPVGYMEMQTFLTQVGAWSSVFTSVPDNNSEAGTRALADETAQSRPGPMLMHSLGADPSGNALTDGYRFLYGPSGIPAPRSDALFIYCQPYLSAAEVAAPPMSRPPAYGSDFARNVQQREFAASAQHASALDPWFGQQENVSPSVASTERFAEQVQLRYQQLARDGLLSHGLAEHRMNIAMDTISKLRSAVAADPSNAQAQLVPQGFITGDQT